MRWRLIALAGVTALWDSAACGTDGREYRSPYSVRYTHEHESLVEDLVRGPRGERREESAVPFREWYSHAVRERWGAWGPPARYYPAPEIVSGKSAEWRRERVIAVGLRYRGYGYQHHHVPDWDPPGGWPWLEVQAGHNGKGLDCSNFTSFVYNQGFGIKPSSAVGRQAEELEVEGPHGRPVRAERINLKGSYREQVEALRTGDLLYVRGRPDGEITHVVIWVGPIGRSPDGTPLILDSHGQGVKDADGVEVPAGIHLRPFREGSWYQRCASHAHRFIRGD